MCIRDSPRGPLSAGDPEPDAENPPETQEAWSTYRAGVAKAPAGATRKAQAAPKAKAASSADPWSAYRPITTRGKAAT
eukprot:8544848-Prorocentrum_lima.AAC.1